MNLMQMDNNSKALAQKAIDSHDGIAAKRAKILLCACEETDIEGVAQKTHWSCDTVKDILKQYEEKGASLLQPRPKQKKNHV